MRSLLSPGGSQNPPGRLKSWFKLCIGVAVLLFLIYVVGPFVDNLPGIKPLADFVDDSGINAAAFYYTGVEEVADSVVSIRNSLEYPPKGQSKTE
jgi:hypothetical protein